MPTKLLVCLSLLTLAACSRGGDGKTDAPPPVVSVTLSGANQLAVPEGSPITLAPVEGGLRLSGSVADGASSNQTAGASFRVVEAQEQAVATHVIRVTINARSTDGATAYRAAYSTNDKGNSGWRDLPLTSAFADASFDYQVPEIGRGADDFIGIMPPATGSIDVASIRVDIVGSDLRQ